MALSDSCFEFLTSFGEAANRLANEAHWYAQPDHPLEYGPEVDALRWAAAAVAKNPRDIDAGARLLRLALSVQAYFDTHPLDPELESRMEEMRQLVRAMQRELTGSDAEAVPYLIRDITSESPEGERAAGRLKEMLPKLGKASYDLAVKVIGDVASSAAKKILGM